MRYRVAAVLFMLLLTFFASNPGEARPNFFDPVEETGKLVFDEGDFFVNGMKMKLGPMGTLAGDYDEDGIVSPIWQELWNLRGKVITIAGYRDRSPDDYDEVYVIFIRGRYYPNPYAK